MELTAKSDFFYYFLIEDLIQSFKPCFYQLIRTVDMVELVLWNFLKWRKLTNLLAQFSS